MKLQKILTILAIIIGVVSIFFWIRIAGAGNEVIESAAENGDTSFIDPIYSIALVVLVISIAVTVIFSLLNIVSNGAALKKTLLAVGIFALIALICFYGLAEGQETPMADGEVLTAGQSQLIGAGLWMFYALAVIAAGAMVFTGVKKMIK